MIGMAEPRRVGVKLSLLTGAVLAGGVLGAMWLFRTDPRDLEIRRLRDVIARLEAERRAAEVVVVEQKPGPDGRVRTRFRFAETAPGRPSDVREFEIAGDVAYFDALVVRFDREFAKLGDETRGRSLHLFRRVFGEFQEPSQGFPLDPFDERGVPAAYRLRDVPSDFEREIWRDFWDLALDPERAQSLGIRVLQGEAVYTKLVPGKLYRLMIEDAGGLTLKVEDAPVLKEPSSRN